jgi:import inner membrane translocase subunit TIM23
MPNSNLPRRLVLNNFTNSVLKNTMKYSAAAGSAGLLYCMNAKFLNFFLEDELAELTTYQKNILCGFLTGAIFKSTRKPIAIGVSAMCGVGVITGLDYLVDYLRENELVNFELKF